MIGGLVTLALCSSLSVLNTCENTLNLMDLNFKYVSHLMRINLESNFKGV